MINKAKVILFVDDKPIWGGGQKVLCDYLSYLEDYTIIVIRPSDAPEDPSIFENVTLHPIDFPDYPKNLSSLKVQIKVLPSILNLALKIKIVLHKYDVKLIVCNTLYSLIPLKFIPSFIPILFVAHNTDYPQNKFSRLLINSSKRVIGVSQDVLDTLNIPLDKQKLIYNSAQVPEDIKGNTLREELNWQHHWVPAYIGRLSPEKNIDSLIRALGIYNEREGHAMKLMIIGDGLLRQELECLCDDLKLKDSVYFAGMLNDPFPLLNTMDAVCLTAHAEGCPLVILEAMMMKLPILGTPCCGIKELLSKPMGLNVLTDDMSPEAIYRGLKDLRLRKRGDQQSLEMFDYSYKHYSSSSQSKQLRELIFEILN